MVFAMVPCGFCFQKGCACLTTGFSRNPSLKPMISWEKYENLLKQLTKVDKSRQKWGHQGKPRNHSFSRDIHQKQIKVDTQKVDKSRQKSTPGFLRKSLWTTRFHKSGHEVDRKWIESEQKVYIVYGKQVDSMWKTSGQYMKRTWTVYIKIIDKSW